MAYQALRSGDPPARITYVGRLSARTVRASRPSADWANAMNSNNGSRICVLPFRHVRERSGVGVARGSPALAQSGVRPALALEAEVGTTEDGYGSYLAHYS